MFVDSGFCHILRNPTNKDWVTTVKKDLEYLDMKEMTMEDIRIMKKISFMKMVKEKNRIKHLRS